MTKYQDLIYRGSLGMSAYFYERIQPFHADPLLQKFVDDNIKKYNVNSFVETGTFRGDTLGWVADKYPNIHCYSIERFRHYYILARIKFRRYNNVNLFRGDSGILIQDVISHIKQPILFWLDAHWGNALPLENELRTIRFKNPQAIVIIDDISSSYQGKTITKEMIESFGFKVNMFNATVATFRVNL